AYLVPAVEHALGSDAPVVIATATLALQSQIINRDLPRMLASLEPTLPRAVDVALLKGRANYVCKHKLHGAAMSPEDDGLIDSTDVSGQPLSQMGGEVTRVRHCGGE